MEQIVNRGKVVIGVSYGISLFGEIDPIANRLSGFDIDLGREIARELGLAEDQIEFVDTLVEDRIPALQEGRVDMVILAMTITPERAQLIDFSRPYFLAGQSILVRKTTSTISSIRDLGGKEVCLVPSSTSVPVITAQAPAAEIVYQPTFPDCVAEMNDGNVDAVSTDDIILAGFASKDQNLTLVGGQFTREPYGVAFAKGKEDLVDFVDTIINTMIVDGRWGKIYYEYLGDIPGLPSVSEAKSRLPASGEVSALP
jgi:polar amino acid transport system substrate-binding protein